MNEIQKFAEAVNVLIRSYMQADDLCVEISQLAVTWPAPEAPYPPTQDAHRWVTELVCNLAKKHWPEVTRWKPLPSLLGVITQLDNMTAGMVRARGSAWRPMSEAPKDGTELLLIDDEGTRVVGRWSKHNHVPLYGWVRQIELYGEEVDGFDAVRWMPLPAGPAQEGG